MNMEWKDYDEFERKYGSDFNLDNYAKRTTTMIHYNMLGSLVERILLKPRHDTTWGYGESASSGTSLRA
jgi:hypothetical protein